MPFLPDCLSEKKNHAQVCFGNNISHLFEPFEAKTYGFSVLFFGSFCYEFGTFLQWYLRRAFYGLQNLNLHVSHNHKLVKELVF